MTNTDKAASFEQLPNGVGVLTVPAQDWDAVQELPDALQYQGRIYGRSGWNSDRFVAYFRTDVEVAYVR